MNFMNFISFIIKFIKFKPIIKFKKFERHNYDSQCIWALHVFIKPQFFTFIFAVFLLNVKDI